MQSFLFYTLDKCIISEQLKQNKIWEPHLHPIFESYINKNSIVIECGCHIGTHTIKLASLCSKLYGFEPMPDTYDVLMRNLHVNNINNTVIYKKGASNKEGLTKFLWITPNNPGGSGLDSNPMGKPDWVKTCDKDIKVELITIDSMNLCKLDFMKIDVEGYETLVIEGAMNTIKQCKPVIVMEVWKNHNSEVDINHTKNLFKNLLDIGYEVTHIEGPDFLFVPK